MRQLFTGAVLLGLLGCAAEDTVLLNVQSGGAPAQGGVAQAGSLGGVPHTGAAQGGASSVGGAEPGGFAQGGDSTKGGGSATGGPTACRTNIDCEAGFCEKSRCADELGQCERRDVFCEGLPLAPVCGCDSVTYFNDCWRRQAGVVLNARGECRDPRASCDRSVDCENGAVCVRLFGSVDQCSPGPGTCWRAPDTCDSMGNVPNFVECGPAPGACVDMCTAIHLTGRPFARVPGGCPQP